MELLEITGLAVTNLIKMFSGVSIRIREYLYIAMCTGDDYVLIFKLIEILDRKNEKENFRREISNI